MKKKNKFFLNYFPFFFFPKFFFLNGSIFSNPSEKINFFTLKSLLIGYLKGSLKMDFDKKFSNKTPFQKFWHQKNGKKICYRKIIKFTKIKSKFIQIY